MSPYVPFFRVLARALIILCLVAVAPHARAANESITQIGFVSVPPDELLSGAPGNFAIQTQDGNGSSVQADESITFIVHDNSSGGVFYSGNLAGGCTSALSLNVITINAGSANKAFCYSNETPGEYEIVAYASIGASSDIRTSAVVLVLPENLPVPENPDSEETGPDSEPSPNAAIATLAFTIVPEYPIPAGDAAGFVVQVRDAAGEPVQGASGIQFALSDGGAGGAFYNATGTAGPVVCGEEPDADGVISLISGSRKAFCYTNSTPGTYAVAADASGSGFASVHAEVSIEVSATEPESEEEPGPDPDPEETPEDAVSIEIADAVSMNGATPGTVRVDISAGTIASGPAGWDGVIAAPAVVDDPIEPGENGYVVSSIRSVRVGSAEHQLSFDRPVRILFEGMAGGTAGWIDGDGGFIEIDDACDDVFSPTLAEGGDCVAGDDGHLIIWTRHFTVFTAYTLEAERGRVIGYSGGPSRMHIEPVRLIDAPAVPQVLGAQTVARSVVLRRSAAFSMDVFELQKRLFAEGFDPGVFDGYFGPRTEAAVKAFQVDRGLVADGIVGPLTHAALYAGGPMVAI